MISKMFRLQLLNSHGRSYCSTVKHQDISSRAFPYRVMTFYSGPSITFYKFSIMTIAEIRERITLEKGCRGYYITYIKDDKYPIVLFKVLV